MISSVDDVSSLLILLVLGHLVEAVTDTQHDIAGNDIVEGLGATLLVDGEMLTLEVAQQIDTPQTEQQGSFQEGLVEGGIPHKLVGVHLAGTVASMGEVVQIGAELELPG